MKKTFYLFMALLTLATLNACSKSDSETNTTGDVQQEDSASTADIDLADAKLAAYITCINDHSNTILDDYSRYQEWADETEGPSVDVNPYGLINLYHDPQECIDDIQAAKALKPSYPELEKAGDDYAAALATVAPLIDEAYEYYDEENYKDDAMAKGKEMHPKLTEAFKAYDAADATLRAELDVIQSQLDEKRLESIEKTEGKGYGYFATSVMLNAGKVADQGNVIDLNEVDVEAFQKGLDALETSIDELDAYHQAHGDELMTTVQFDNFLDQCNEYLKAAKDLMRRARDKTPYTDLEQNQIGTASEWMVDGSPGQMIQAYNKVVDYSNTLTY